MACCLVTILLLFRFNLENSECPFIYRVYELKNVQLEEGGGGLYKVLLVKAAPNQHSLQPNVLFDNEKKRKKFV